MRRKMLELLMAMLIGVGALFPVPAFAAACPSSDPTFFGLKSWHAYLTKEDMHAGGRTTCVVSKSNFEGEALAPSIWKIVLTILSDLFFVAGFLAVILIAFGGFQFITSSGDAAKAQKAKKSIVSTVVGLIIVILASVIVNTVLSLLT